MTRAVDLQSCFVAEKAGERVVDGDWEFRERDFWALLRTLINAVQEQKVTEEGLKVYNSGGLSQNYSLCSQLT